LLLAGYTDEALAWRDWLFRAIAGDPDHMQILYSIVGERRLPEIELPWLAGYEGSKPVRIGNAAHEQFQLDVYGELVEAFYVGCRTGAESSPDLWNHLVALMAHLEKVCNEPDEGIWEIRGPCRHFTHAKLMAWLAFDRVVKSVEDGFHVAPVGHWRTLRDRIHREICEKASIRSGRRLSSTTAPTRSMPHC